MHSFNVKRNFMFVAFVLSSTVSHSAFAVTDYSIQNTLSGANSVMATANYGKGVLVGVLDTGITPSIVFNPSYNGQGLNNIDSAKSGKCLNGTCTAGVYPTDGNGHGTFVASEIVGGYRTNPNVNLSGVAPGASLMAVQVLSASGSGTFGDVANAIRYSADRGAMVLNLSLGPSYNNSQTQAQNAASMSAAYQSLASAVNYAASKGVYMVFAGGNDAKMFDAGGKLTGFTDAAIQHLMIVGSTNASKQLSSFSNTAGTGSFQSTSGKTYNYSSIWVMADGEGIYGASNSNSGQCAGYGCITQMSGTSMAAPQGTGAIALLLAEWPVLKTNGYAANILEATATDLGTKGIDNSYGNGFMNLAQAFQPLGTLSVTTTAGKSVAVSTLTGSMLTGGALGSLPSITAQLKSYTAFDSYQRNFLVDLSGLVASKSSGSASSAAVTAPKTTTSATKFADGSSLAFGNIEAAKQLDHPGSSSKQNSNWFMSFTDASGSTMAAGSGFPASASFAGAMWGTDSPVGAEVYSLGISNSLVSLAEGGTFGAYGMALDSDTRVAFSWSETAQDQGPASMSWTNANASAFSGGITTNLTPSWMAGVTFGMLNQKNGLLGTTYGEGPVGFGEENKSMSFGMTSAFALGDGLDFLLDASIVRTAGANMTDGIVTSVTPLYARAMGASLAQRDAVKTGDNLSLSVRAPLRVVSGSANLAMTSVDGNGVNTTTNQRVSLRPNGTEMDFALGYQAPVGDSASWNLGVNARRDADNVAGASEVDFLLGGKVHF